MQTTTENKTMAASLEGVDSQRLAETGDRLLRAQQARLITVRAEHEQARTERLNYYRGEMQRLADEAEHELVLLERGLAESVTKLEAMIGKLKALRGS